MDKKRIKGFLTDVRLFFKYRRHRFFLFFEFLGEVKKVYDLYYGKNIDKLIRHRGNRNGARTLHEMNVQIKKDMDYEGVDERLARMEEKQAEREQQQRKENATVSQG